MLLTSPPILSPYLPLQMGCISTVESIVYALQAIEPETKGLDSLLNVRISPSVSILPISMIVSTKADCIWNIALLCSVVLCLEKCHTNQKMIYGDPCGMKPTNNDEGILTRNINLKLDLNKLVKSCL